MSDVTKIILQIESGDPSAAERLLPLVYEERQTRPGDLRNSFVKLRVYGGIRCHVCLANLR